MRSLGWANELPRSKLRGIGRPLSLPLSPIAGRGKGEGVRGKPRGMNPPGFKTAAGQCLHERSGTIQS